MNERTELFQEHGLIHDNLYLASTVVSSLNYSNAEC